MEAGGILLTLAYGAFVVWLYATRPASLAEVRTGARVAAGTYAVDTVRFDAALSHFRRGQYRAARDEWARADPAQRDARTQFYIAYAFYREGWGRLASDDVLYRAGVEAAQRAIDLSPGRPLVVVDPDLRIHAAAELKAELQEGTERTWSDLDPRRTLRERK